MKTEDFQNPDPRFASPAGVRGAHICRFGGRTATARSTPSQRDLPAEATDIRWAAFDAGNPQHCYLLHLCRPVRLGDLPREVWTRSRLARARALASESACPCAPSPQGHESRPVQQDPRCARIHYG